MQVTKFNLVTDLQIMLSNVTHSNFYFECNTERGSIDQLYIELGLYYVFHNKIKDTFVTTDRPVVSLRYLSKAWLGY